VQAEEITLTEALHTKSFDTDESILHEIMRVDKERRSGNNHNSLPLVNVGIPLSVTIDCPIVRPMIRSAINCKKCEFFKGIVQTSWSDKEEISWSHKYAVRCGFILERKTRQIVAE